MGCDIHQFAEKLIDGKWTKISGFISNYYDPDNEYFSTDEYKDSDSIIDRRNYTLFALLANVRNGFGFAGCDTGDAIKPISMPKGIPEDVSNEIMTEYEEWGCDAHSASWLTAEEINNYDKLGFKVYRGWVDVETYKEFRKTGKVNSSCGGVSGGMVMHESNETCEQVQLDNPDKDVYTQIEWEEPLNECVSGLFDDVLKQLMERSDTGKGDDVRIVFWFDN